MMGAYFGGIMIWWALLVIALLLGFAYIVWVLSAKESGGTKITGMVIAIAIAVFTVVLFLYGSIYGGAMMRGGMMGGYDRGDQDQFFKEMLKNPQMHQMMRDYIEREKR